MPWRCKAFTIDDPPRYTNGKLGLGYSENFQLRPNLETSRTSYAGNGQLRLQRRNSLNKERCIIPRFHSKQHAKPAKTKPIISSKVSERIPRGFDFAPSANLSRLVRRARGCGRGQLFARFNRWESIFFRSGIFYGTRARGP